MDFWDILQYLFTDPKAFFRKVDRKNIMSPMLLFLGTTLIVDALVFMLTVLTSSGVITLPRFWTNTIINVLGLVITSPIIYGLLRLMKVHAQFREVIVIYAYSLMPFLIIQAIPILGWLSIIYSIALMIIGLSVFYDISYKKAAVVVLVPLGIVLSIILVLFILFLFIIFSFIGF